MTEQTEEQAKGYRPVAVLTQIEKTYHLDSVSVPVIRGVDIFVRQACFTVLLGPLGSGKTTLLNMIGALDAPTSGSVTIAGREITHASRKELFEMRRHTVGFIFQTFNLFPGLTALENVEFGAEVAGAGDPRDRAQETLERVGLGERIGHFPHELSGGEQQRVAIARALVTSPPLILADEPTGNLDSTTADEVFALMRAANRDKGVAFLMVTHDRELASRCDRIVELVDGRIAR